MTTPRRWKSWRKSWIRFNLSLSFPRIWANCSSSLFKFGRKDNPKIHFDRNFHKRKLVLLNSFKHDVTKIDNQNIFTVRKVLHILLDFFCTLIIHHVMNWKDYYVKTFKILINCNNSSQFFKNEVFNTWFIWYCKRIFSTNSL